MPQDIKSIRNDLFDYKLAGNDFIRSVVKLILDREQIVGNGKFISSVHSKFIDFKYPHELEKIFDCKVSDKPQSHDDLLDLCRKTIAHSLKTIHPHFRNSLFGGIDQYGLAGSWLTEALNCSMAVWELSPVFGVMERQLIDFLGSLAGFHSPEGLFCPGGSMANCFAMLLARHQLLPDIKENGLFNRGQLVVFVSDQAHYSFSKMSIMLGHGTKSVIKVKTNSHGEMIPEELEKAIIGAKERGVTPFMVAATAGTTVFGAFDPLVPISTICRKYHLWLHVDGALGGAWILSKKHKERLLKGLELADSLTWDFHKMLSLPVYCSLILVNGHRDLFAQAFSLNAQYLFQKDKYYDKRYDAGDKSVQCIRKVESLKLVLFMKAHGLGNLERLVDNAHDMSRYFEQKISTRPNFRLLFSEASSTNICFFYIPDQYLSHSLSHDQFNQIAIELKRRMMESGTLMVAYQPIGEKNIPACFRLNIAALPELSHSDIDSLVEKFELLGKDIILEQVKEL